MYSIPGFDEDRHSEMDAARPVLTDEERAELADYDRWVAQLAATEVPLDGCEDDAPDWHDISAPVDAGEVATLLEGAPMAMTATW